MSDDADGQVAGDREGGMLRPGGTLPRLVPESGIRPAATCEVLARRQQYNLTIMRASAPRLSRAMHALSLAVQG